MSKIILPRPASQASPTPSSRSSPTPRASGPRKSAARLHYFGPWDDPDGALAKYLEQKDALHAGRKPRPDPNAATVKDAVNAFLNQKKALLDAGELSPHTFANYKRAADTLVSHMGKTRLVADLDPEDFAALRNKMAKKWGPHRLAVTIQHVRSVFKFAFDAGLIPTRFGSGPGSSDRRRRPFVCTGRSRGRNCSRPTKSAGILGRRRRADEGDDPARASTADFGNSDCGNLPMTALDLESGWSTSPVRRRASVAAARSGRKPCRRCGRRWRAPDAEGRDGTPACSS